MWLGTDDATGQPVTLRLVQGDRETIHAGMSSAILVMRALQHPHVTPVHDMIDSPAGPVLVLGAAEGGSLTDILMVRRTLPPGEMVTACAPIAEALAEIHPHGIVHGAITTDEILFARDGRPMLAGIGLASIGGQVALQGPTIAPEVSAGSGFAPPADVYSIAAMGVVALTGPIAPDRLFAASAERLLATGVTPAAQAVITRAIGLNIGRRPTAETLVNALYAIADPEPVELVLPEDEPQAGPVPGYGAPPFSDPLATPPQAAPTSMPHPSSPSAMPPASSPSAMPGSSPETTSAFGGDDSMEMDEVTAFMRQVSDAPPRRRGRRSGGGSGDTGEFARSGELDRVSDAGTAGETGRSARTEGGSHTGRRAKQKADAAAGSGAGRRGRSRRSEQGQAAKATPPDEPKRRGRSGGDTEAPAAKGGRSGGRRPSRGDMTKVASVLVVMLLVAGAVVIGMQIFGDEEELPEAGIGSPESVTSGQGDLCGGPRPAPEEEPAEVSDWTQEVQRLYQLRAEAFEKIDAELLCQVYAPTSKGLVRDVQLMQEYADENVRTQDLSFEVIDAELVEKNGGTAVIKISDRLPAYQLVDNDGKVVEEKPGMENDTWQAELVPIADDGSATPTWRFG